MSVRCQISWPIGFLVEEIRARSSVVSIQTSDHYFLHRAVFDKSTFDNYYENTFIGLFLKSIYIGVEDEKLRINHGQSRTCFLILSIIFKENFFSARA